MKTRRLTTLLSWMIICISACQPQTEYCTVKGTVEGVRDGALLTLQDAWNKFKVISTATVENGTFEFHPGIPAPTHVYLYAENPKDVIANPYDGGQLKDFMLEPGGTIIVDVNAADESDMSTGAAGTVLNDTYRTILSADPDSREALWEEAMNDLQSDLLALLYAENNSREPARALEILDGLSPETAKAYKRFISYLRKRCARNLKAQERENNQEESTEDSVLFPRHYIDFEYQDTEGKPVSLSSVVDNPANRYVILDFWATWCGSCIKSIPTLKEMYGKYHDKGLEIFSISQDSKAREWKSFVAENEMTWVNVLSRTGRVYKDYGIEVIPTVFIIDCKTGEILVRDNQPDLESLISGLFQ
ncbi:MAG: AhpC/TSA family protein [Bacteroidales bacterium]|nr:AhpC/TSA family protein [Bacteroidales bacterium]